MTSDETSVIIKPPCILQLCITRYRGIEYLKWNPAAGVNIILGGGDTGKTTILEAIALLLSPVSSYSPSLSDYWCGDASGGFVIEAVVDLPGPRISRQSRMIWPWYWDGENAVLPPTISEDDANPKDDSAYTRAYRLRVRGTIHHEVEYELVQPDGEVEDLTVNLRRDIGVLRLAGDDRNDQDLRLVRWSSLDKLLSDVSLRSRIGASLVDQNIVSHLTEDGKSALESLDKRFRDNDLPQDLSLGITGGGGASLNAMIGLTASKNGSTLPLTTWGSGTRRLSALRIADAIQDGTPITVIDEIERGLEPYRQRKLMQELQERDGQVFITTHSPIALAAGAAAGLWYMDVTGKLGRLHNDSILKHGKLDANLLLARLGIVCEGATEVGFVSALLERAIPELDYTMLGIWVADGGGNDSSRLLLKALTGVGLSFAGFVDDEDSNSGDWLNLRMRMGDMLFQWPGTSIEKYLLARVPLHRLIELIADSDNEWEGMRYDTLKTRLGNEDLLDACVANPDDSFRQLIIAAASGEVPAGITNKSEKKRFKSQSQVWFKTQEGGRELARKVFELAIWEDVAPLLMPFINSVRTAVRLPTISSTHV